MNDKLCGIYCIRNIINNKRYIGQSRNIHQRFIAHKSYLTNIKHGNQMLQTEWQVYGEDNFVFEIIEQCDVEMLNDKEIYYIKFYNSLYDGYNRTSGGEKDFSVTEEKRQQMIEINPNKKPVCQFDIYGNLIKKYDGIKIASRDTGIRKETISRCCQNKYHFCSKGYFWKFQEDCIEDYITTDEIIENFKRSIFNPVIQMNKENIILKIWINMSDFVKEIGYGDVTSISACCRKKRKSAIGYKWMYYVDYLQQQ